MTLSQSTPRATPSSWCHPGSGDLARRLHHLIVGNKFVPQLGDEDVVEVVLGPAAVYRHIDRTTAAMVPRSHGWPCLEGRAVFCASDAAETFGLSLCVRWGSSGKNEPPNASHR